uniref:Solute carrier organic anion transporter family member n=1 Tax=Plectus sambesii TaxID=2011161 RepID=A0A914XR68_9BILA
MDRIKETMKNVPPLNRMYCFFALFCFVYFLEAIGGVYMVSALQSIERQFQIPSKMSGLMISASDFGYIPTVAFISYMGSKGNRARWIGGGCLLIAFANFMIATPNFLFRDPPPVLNLSTVKDALRPPSYLADSSVRPEQLLNYGPFKDRMMKFARNELTNNVHGVNQSDLFKVLFGDLFENVQMETKLARHKREEGDLSNPSNPNMDEMKKMTEFIKKTLIEEQNATVYFDLLKRYIVQKLKEEPDMAVLKEAQKSATAPYGFCNAIVNELRKLIDDMKCARNHTKTGPFAIIFIALFFLGIGRTMPWSLGVPLIDDNVKRKNLPVYFAGMFFIRILGPILGFSIGSFSNRLYYTLETPPGLSPRDPTWIGAWWLGFLIIAAVMAGPSLALFLFPNPMKKASDADEEQENSEKITPKKKMTLNLVDKHVRKGANGESLVPQGFQNKIADFQKAVVEIMKSPIYSGSLVGRILDVLAFKGFMVFLPKYLENHYGIPQYKVQMYLAMFGIIGFAVGMVSGSFVMRRFKLEGRRAASFVAICSFAAIIISCSKMFLGCHSVVNSVGLKGQELGFNYTSECNADCSCDSVDLFPVCDVAGTPYYSPCHAGCRNVTIFDAKSYDIHFTDCQCTESGSIVKRDWCKDDCQDKIVVYFALVIVSGIVGGMGVIPGVLIILRSVAPEHRSISLGVSGFLISLLATLPSPVIWGYIIDNACLVWDKTCTGSGGACTIYEPNTLRISMHLVYGIIRCVALLSDVWVWYYATDLKLMTEEKENDEVEKVEKIEMR